MYVYGRFRMSNSSNEEAFCPNEESWCQHEGSLCQNEESLCENEGSCVKMKSHSITLVK